MKKTIEQEHKENFVFIETYGIKKGTIVKDHNLNERIVKGIHPTYGWIIDEDGRQINISSIYEVATRTRPIKEYVWEMFGYSGSVMATDYDSAKNTIMEELSIQEVEE